MALPFAPGSVRVARRRRASEGDQVRIGLMIGPEKGRYREKVARLVADAEAAEQAGLRVDLGARRSRTTSTR